MSRGMILRSQGAVDRTRVMWSPSRYLKFQGERLQPAVDLLARIALDDPALVVDLGVRNRQRYQAAGRSQVLPSGPSLKLLDVTQRKGVESLA